MLINTSNFIFDIPKLNPLSREYINYWRQQKIYDIEGYWDGGIWMPPSLFFYGNHSTIKLNKGRSNIKSYGRPLIRDIEWDTFRYYTIARGFSGFENDDYYSCNNILLDYELYNPEDFIAQYPNLIAPDNKPKIYEDPVSYIQKHHSYNLGRPLYENSALNLMMLGARNFGKDIFEDSIIHSEFGPKQIKNVAIGEKIYGADGKLTTILNKEYYTDQLQYEITLLDGRKIEAGAGHRWFVKEKLSHDSKEHVKTTSEILSNFRSGKRKDYNYHLPINKAVEYSEKNLIVDPYLLGVLLGDGCLTQYVTFTSNDPEILDYLNVGTDKVNKLKGKYAYSITGGETLKSIKELKLYKKTSKDKFIPMKYLYSSISQRLELLKGLLDTDGHISKSGNIEFVTKSKQLYLDVLHLSRSLGFYTTFKITKENFYRIYIRADVPLFKLGRKIDRTRKYEKASFKDWVAIKSIVPTEVKPSVCLQIDNEDKLFLANDFIVTHNSYMVGSGIILHNFLFDGVFSYEDSQKEDVSTEVMVGAYESKYINLLLEKTKDALERLPGEVELNGKVYNAPFSRRYKGSWDKEITFSYKKKIGGEWKNRGTQTNIKNRTFGDNAYAGIGSRPTIFIVEEVGLCRNIKDIHAAMKDAQRDGLKKFATSIYLGTGGEMDLGAAAASEIFYNPEQYECLHFPDIYENRGRISYFIPAYKARQEFKDANGFTIIDKAKKAIEDIRNKFKLKSSSDALNKEIINNPIVPSEMFITKSSNLFPSIELANRLSFIEVNNLYDKIAKKVELYFDPESEYNGVNYKLDTVNRLKAIDKFPMDDSHSDRDGCVVIYELPQTVNGVVPESTYVIGVDPYKDDSIRGQSLAAVYVIKTSKHFDKIGHDEVVATYIGRPYMGRDAVNEIIYKLSMFYGNAKVYFENSVGNVKDYFERIKRLDLLARKPHTVFNKKASYESSPIVEYGYPMSNERIKYEALQYVRSWLLEVRESNENNIIRNLDLILDKGLLQELILFSMDGNFDRVMGFAGAIIGLNEMNNVTQESTFSKENPLDAEFAKLLTNNNKIFKNEKFSQATNSFF